MAKIVNLSGGPFVLPTNHIVPEDGFLDTTDAVLLCPDNAFVLSGPVLSGQLSISYDSDDLEPVAAEVMPAMGSGNFSTTMTGDDTGEQEES